MRDVRTIKNQRELLMTQRNSYNEIIQQLMRKGKERNEHETNVLRAAGEARRVLQAQINALTYVLNEDTELDNAVQQSFYFDRYGIDHDAIMGVFE